MAVATTITTTTKKRSGGIPAAPFVVGAFVVVAGLWLSWFTLPGRDTIAHRLPANVSSYMHGYASSTWLIGDARIESLQPTEFAVVTIATSDGDRVVTIVRFSPFHRTPEDALTTLDAHMLDVHTYAIGDAGLLDATNSARFMDDEVLADALAATRSAFDVQFYLTPSTTVVPWLTAATPTIIGGLSVHDNMMMGMLAAPKDVPHTIFGYRSSDESTTRTAPLVPNDAMMTLVPDEGSSTDAVSITMHVIDAARTASNTPRSDILDAASADLSHLLEGSSISLFDTHDASAAVTVLPAEIDGETLRDALSRYIAASIPDRRPLSLPDGSWTTELLYTDGPVLEYAGPHTFRLTERFRTYAATDLFIMEKEGRFVIADSIPSLSKGLEARPANHPCTTRVTRPSLLIHQPMRFGGMHPVIDALFVHAEVQGVRASLKADSTVKICGYF